MQTRRALFITVLSVVTALAAPVAANAATVQVSSGSTILVTEGAPEDNDITVTFSGSAYEVTDTLVNPTPGSGCLATADPKTVSCSGSLTSFQGNGKGSDRIDSSSVNLFQYWTQEGAGTLNYRCGGAQCYVFGAEGNDHIVGGSATDYLRGRGGNDTLEGRRNGDGLDGGTGDDTLKGGADYDSFSCEPGDDSISGGSGQDSYGCSGSETAVKVTLDDVANDGSTGEHDNVGSDVENITGSPLNDRIVGDSSSNYINGGDGDDRLLGMDGDDNVNGGYGDDRIAGGPGDDSVSGEKGRDKIRGGAGFDAIYYWDSDAGVRVSLDGKRNDGARGERDNVGTDIEEVYGSDFDDVIIGSNRSNDLSGNGGDDRMFGMGGNDEVSGDDGRDTLSGGTGNDQLNGGDGDDQLEARDLDGDVVSCGMGTDTAWADLRRTDQVWNTCERVFRRLP